jgi:hypothetical protein
MLAGIGAVTAQGGAGGRGGCTSTLDDGGSGGGGRIAIYYVTNNGFNLNSITSAGGTGASAGTVQTAFLRGGDCDGDDKVSIAEVQAAINMYLGIMPVSACVDSDNSGSVSIAEVQKVINGYLGL